MQADSLPAEPQGKPKVYVAAAAAAAKSLQLCPTLLNPMDCSLPGSSTHGIFQARVLEWAAVAFSDSITAEYYSIIGINHILVLSSSSDGH